MAEMSNYLEDELLDHVLSAATYTAPATVYLALSTATITDTTTGTTITEHSGDNYSRKSVTNNATNWPAASSASKSLGVTQTFATPSGSWGTITDMAIIDAASNGNILLYTALTASKAVASGNTVEFTSSNITAAFNSTNISTYLANELLDHVLSAAAYTAPATVYMALCTASVAASDTGSTITEVAGGVNYSRLAITNNATNFPASSGGSKSNGATWTFATPSGSWGTITHWALCDASSAGNVLFFGALGASAAPGNGDTVRFQTSAFTFSFL